MCVRIIFIWLHNLSTCIAHSRWLADTTLSDRQPRADDTIGVDTSALLLLGTLLEEDLAKHVLLLAKGVVVLHVVVVGLVKHAV